MQTILVLKGVPGSGKSTFATSWISNSPDTRRVVNRDTIRKELGCFPIGNKQEEKRVSEKEIKLVTDAIENGKDVCIDATNLNLKTIDKWANLASKLGAKIEYKEFVISLEEALKRDKIREKPVGKKVLFKFYEQYFPEEFDTFFRDKRLNNIQRKNIPDKKAIICDLDGTLSLNIGRSPYDYSKLITDKPEYNLKRLLLTLSKNYDILFVTGRNNSCRELTEK